MYQGLGQMLTMCLKHPQGCSETPKCAYVIYGQPLLLLTSLKNTTFLLLLSSNVGKEAEFWTLQKRLSRIQISGTGPSDSATHCTLGLVEQARLTGPIAEHCRLVQTISVVFIKRELRCDVFIAALRKSKRKKLTSVYGSGDAQIMSGDAPNMSQTPVESLKPFAIV